MIVKIYEMRLKKIHNKQLNNSKRLQKKKFKIKIIKKRFKMKKKMKKIKKI